ncbi:unnamed protein product [Fusarium venenatum]|uniref:Uncharacterized protein n=1 Tax=Fusarium venenatum TaxID=56646 RepID=A0A2L2TCZ8_9HYPO|nr:uncharacterized protein FVRRES_05292 [Fusarium venenatum]CEI60856.1 unnamed protein product [Fusarium venenatum]
MRKPGADVKQEAVCRSEDEDEENLKRGRLHFEIRQLSEARKGWEGDQGGRDGRDTRDARTRPGWVGVLVEG